jgi:hypothetical protein
MTFTMRVKPGERRRDDLQGAYERQFTEVAA